MLPYLPSGVSDQRAADGNGCLLPVHWQTYTGNDPFAVQTGRVPAPGDNPAANGIGGRRCAVGRSAGRCAGIYNNSGHVEIILEKNLGGS